VSDILTNLVFHHVAVITPDIEMTSTLYQKMGYNSSAIIEDPIQDVQIILLSKDNHPLIELIQPQKETSHGQSLLKKNGVTPYHFCYKTNSINETIKELKNLRFLQITAINPCVAFIDHEVCFMFQKKMGIIELIAKKAQ